MRKLKLFCIDFLFILLVFLFLLPDIGAQPATFDSITITSPSPGSTQSGTFDITAKTEGTGVSNGPFFYWASTGNQINGSIELTYLDDDDNGIYDGIEYIISFESATFIHGLATNLNLIVRAFGGSPGQWREHTIQINVDNRTCDEMPNLLSPADDYEFPYGVTLPGFQWSASLNQNCTEEYVIKFMVRDYWNNWVTFCLIPTGTNTSYNYSSSACNYILAKDVEYRWSVGIRSNGVNNYSGAQIRSFKLKNISSPVLSSADGSSNSGEINISFNSVSGAQGYKLYYDDDNTGDYTGTGATGGSSPISLSTSQTNYTISGLDAGKTYYFAVKAVDGANWSDYSNEKYATTSGTINANQTWPGSGNPSTLTINGNITVASGVTLTVSPGSTVKFASGKYLKAYGTLDAQGTSSNNITFTSSGSSWGGIQISGGSASSSELEYCTIQNAGIGIDVSNSSPLIKKCYIYSCSSYPLKLTSGATPKVLDNKFYAGSTHSVYISSAGGDFGANAFRTSSGTTYGVYITGSTANPNFDNKWGYGGNLFDLANISSHGAYATGGYPEFGSHGAREGENDFINRGSDYYIKNNTGATIDAEYNYWGGTPQESWFGNTEIDYFPYESSSNGAGPSWKVMTNPFQPGLTKYEEGRYSESLVAFKSALEQNIESDDAAGAVFKMAMSALKTGVLEEQATFLTDLLNSTHPEVQYISRIWLAYSYFLQSKMENAEKIALQAPVGSLAERSELLSLVSYYSTLGDLNAAARITEILKNHHKDSYLTYDLEQATNSKILFQNYLSKPKTTELSGFSIGNYPNPVNPETTISYSIPEKTLVQIKVFDLRGRLVRILVHEVQDKGQYDIFFNAGNLPSGIYPYTIEAAGRKASARLIILK